MRHNEDLTRHSLQCARADQRGGWWHSSHFKQWYLQPSRTLSTGFSILFMSYQLICQWHVFFHSYFTDLILTYREGCRIIIFKASLLMISSSGVAYATGKGPCDTCITQCWTEFGKYCPNAGKENHLGVQILIGLWIHCFGSPVIDNVNWIFTWINVEFSAVAWDYPNCP